MKSVLLVALLVVFSVSTVHSQNSTTVDPNITTWLNKVLAVLGLNKLIDGTPATQQGPLQGPLNSIAPSFDEAHLYGAFAFAAYCDQTLATWTCDYCVEGYTFLVRYLNNLYGSFAYFAKNDDTKTIVLTFRGTYNVPNLVLLDAALYLTPAIDNGTSNIKVYKGFKTAAKSLFPQVVAELRNLTALYPDYKVVVTGHSLGAAQAALTLFYLKYENLFPNTVFELFAYGCPRTGNRAYADYMNALPIKIGRIVHKADIIPHGLSLAVAGFYHFQHEIWITTNDGAASQQQYCATNVYEDPNCSDSLGPLYSIPDHFVQYYEYSYFTCLLEDPIDFVIQLVLPMKAFIPLPLIDELNLYPLTGAVQLLLNALDNYVPVVG